MEYLTIQCAAIKAKAAVNRIKDHRAFLNVSPIDNFGTFWIIMSLKSLMAGYAATERLNIYVTKIIAIGSFINTYFYGDAWNFPIILLNMDLFATNRFPRWRTVNASTVWFVSCMLSPQCQFLLDAYVIISIIVFVYGVYYNEMDKAATLIFFTICLNWYVDYNLGRIPLNLHETVTILILLICILVALPPDEDDVLWHYLGICASLCAFFTFKFYRIWVIKGLHDHPYSFPIERYRPFVTFAHFILHIEYKDLVHMIKKAFGFREDGYFEVILNLNGNSSVKYMPSLPM